MTIYERDDWDEYVPNCICYGFTCVLASTFLRIDLYGKQEDHAGSLQALICGYHR